MVGQSVSREAPNQSEMLWTKLLPGTLHGGMRINNRYISITLACVIRKCIPYRSLPPNIRSTPITLARLETLGAHLSRYHFYTLGALQSR